MYVIIFYQILVKNNTKTRWLYSQKD
jgi:hypothetical protein